MVSEPLSNTLVGDILVVNSRYGDRLVTVTHTTPTQVHVGSTKYNRAGRPIGASRDQWCPEWAKPATAEDIARIKAEKKHAHYVATLLTLKRDQVESLSLERLHAIIQLLNGKTPKGEVPDESA